MVKRAILARARRERMCGGEERGAKTCAEIEYANRSPGRRCPASRSQAFVEYEAGPDIRLRKKEEAIGQLRARFVAITTKVCGSVNREEIAEFRDVGPELVKRGGLILVLQVCCRAIQPEGFKRGGVGQVRHISTGFPALGRRHALFVF